jgi:hypothetical protein
MSYGTGSGDDSGGGLLAFIGITVLVAAAAGYWYSQEFGTGKDKPGQPTFKAVERNGGSAELTCHVCQGEGRTRCGYCGGKGQVAYINKGQNRCPVCSGSGIQVCDGCKGRGKATYQQPTSLQWKGPKP